MHWVFLGIAILAEVIATSALKLTDGFTRLLPSAMVVAGYGLAFYFLALTLRTLNVGVAYAIWAGVGMALIALIGWLVLDQSLDAAGIAGIALIISGVIVLSAVSRSITA